MTSIALFGITGTLGLPLLNALQTKFADKVKFPIKVVTRQQKHPSTDKVHYIEASLTETDKLVSKLQGTDVIIELSASRPEVLKASEAIVLAVKPKLFIPSQFGTDIHAIEYLDRPAFFNVKKTHSQAVRKAGIKVVDIYTALFAEPGTWTYEVVGHYGIDKDKNVVNVIGSTDLRVSLSTYTDIVNTISVIATDSNPSRFPDQFRLHSAVVTIQDIVKKYEEIHGVKLATGTFTTVDDALKQFHEDVKQGLGQENLFFYLHVILSQGKGLYFAKTDRDLVNPGERLWKWEKPLNLA